MWATLNASHDLNKRWSLGMESQFRLDDNFTMYDASVIDIGASYKISKMLKTAATYRFGNSQRVYREFVNRHRFAFDFRIDEGFGEWDLDLRFRYQAAFDASSVGEQNADLKDAMRYRLKADRKLISKTSLAVSLELFQNTRWYQPMLTDWRFRSEVSRKIAKRQSVSLGYMVQRQMNTANPLMQHILLIGYSVDLKFKKKKETTE